MYKKIYNVDKKHFNPFHYVEKPEEVSLVYLEASEYQRLKESAFELTKIKAKLEEVLAELEYLKNENKELESMLDG